MRYGRTSRFRTRHWAQLWKANLPDIQSLKSCASQNTIFVAIDAEPWSQNSSEIAEIGITILAPVNNDVVRPTSLEALYKNFTFRCRCFGVSGRQNRKQKKREKKYWGGKPQVIDAAHVEEAIVQALESIPPSLERTTPCQNPRLCLMGFDLGFEFQFLSALYPRVLQCFSSWVDLQNLVMESAGLTKRPSMHRTLVAFGFKREYPIWRSARVAHNAGNDSLRIVCLLLNLLSHDSKLVMPQDEPSRRKRVGGSRYYHRLMSDNRFFKNRPKPYESFPFAARISLEDHAGAVLSVRRLLDTFTMYNPVAVAAGVIYFDPPYGRGWVCLASLEELNRFVSEVNGRPGDDGVWKGTWRVESYYDPSVTPATTAEELEDWLKARSLAAKEHKILSRKQANMMGKLDPVDVFAGSWVVDECS